MKVYVVGDRGYASWIDNVELVDSVKNADLVMLTGGADVNPAIYGHERNSKTYCNNQRDDLDIIAYEQAQSLNKAVIGVCRGSQMITSLQSGGYLIQHVENHTIGGFHSVVFNDGLVMNATSTHHQMMYPFDVKNHELLAWSNPSRSTVYELANGITTTVEKEPEVVYYPDSNALAIQLHPEMMDTKMPIIKKLNNLIQQKLFKNDKI